MKPKKKNNVFTFFCSLLPGAAEMYTGFMKNGLSLMVIFFASFAVPAMLGVNDLFLCLAFITWFYGFFHARNLAAVEEETFLTLEDRYIWEEFTEGKPLRISDQTGHRWLAGILILAGLGILWNNFRSMIYSLIPDRLWDELYPVVANIPGTIFAILIILVGIRMIQGKKEVYSDGEENQNA